MQGKLNFKKPATIYYRAELIGKGFEKRFLECIGHGYLDEWKRENWSTYSSSIGFRVICAYPIQFFREQNFAMDSPKGEVDW